MQNMLDFILLAFLLKFVFIFALINEDDNEKKNTLLSHSVFIYGTRK